MIFFGILWIFRNFNCLIELVDVIEVILVMIIIIVVVSKRVFIFVDVLVINKFYWDDEKYKWLESMI